MDELHGANNCVTTGSRADAGNSRLLCETGEVWGKIRTVCLETLA